MIIVFYYNYIDKCNQIGKSPSAVAEEMGYQRSVVTRWSKGAVPRQATLQKIADYFGCDVSELTKEKTATPEGDGDRLEFIRAWDEASPEQRALALATLKLKVSPAGSQEKPNP